MVEIDSARTEETIEAYRDCLRSIHSRKAVAATLKNPSFQAALRSQGIDVEAVKKALLPPSQIEEKL